jgi:hypothetical protein
MASSKPVSCSCNYVQTPTGNDRRGSADVKNSQLDVSGGVRHVPEAAPNVRRPVRHVPEAAGNASGALWDITVADQNASDASPHVPVAARNASRTSPDALAADPKVFFDYLQSKKHGPPFTACRAKPATPRPRTQPMPMRAGRVYATALAGQADRRPPRTELPRAKITLRAFRASFSARSKYAGTSAFAMQSSWEPCGKNSHPQITRLHI